jgi:hypothetical protein
MRGYLRWIGVLVFGAACVLPLGAVRPSDAATFYVATSGSDSQPGTAAQPFRTLRRGASSLRAGDTLIVQAGTYAESLVNVFPSGLSWSQPVTVRAAPGATVTLTPPAQTDVFLAFIGDKYHHIVIDGFVIDGQNRVGSTVNIGEGAHHIRLTNCEVKRAKSHGIHVTPGQRAAGDTWGCCNEFLNLDVHDNGLSARNQHGIYLSTSNNLIERSRIYRNGGYGVHVYSSFGGVYKNIVRSSDVYDNNVAGNAAGMILASGGGHQAYNNLIWNNTSGIIVNTTGVQVLNNTIVNNTKYVSGSNNAGIQLNTTTGAMLVNNILYGQSIPILWSNTQVIQSNNLINIDPGFVAAAQHDFRLRAGSRAIDAGIGLKSVLDDFDGVLRPQGLRPDIGAYEFKASGK